MALFAKELETLSLRPRTKAEALVQLRFCAYFWKGIAAKESLRQGQSVMPLTSYIRRAPLALQHLMTKLTSPADREALQTGRA